MSLHKAHTAPAETAADALVVGVFDGGTLTGPAREIDEANGGILSMLIARKEITGRRTKRSSCMARPAISAPLVVTVGSVHKPSSRRHRFPSGRLGGESPGRKARQTSRILPGRRTRAGEMRCASRGRRLSAAWGKISSACRKEALPTQRFTFNRPTMPPCRPARFWALPST